MKTSAQTSEAVRTALVDDGFIAPDRLLPTLPPPVVAEEHWYWIGLLPECPSGSIDLCGISFPRVNEEVTVDGQGRTRRTPCAGALVKLPREKVAQIGERVSRMVFRFIHGAADEPGGAQNMRPQPPRPYAVTLRIPLPAEIAEARRQRFLATHQPYVPRTGDVAAAHYIYLVHIDEVSPAARPISARLPDPIAVSGIRPAPPDARPVPASERCTIGGALAAL